MLKKLQMPLSLLSKLNNMAKLVAENEFGFWLLWKKYRQRSKPFMRLCRINSRVSRLMSVVLTQNEFSLRLKLTRCSVFFSQIF